MSPAPYPELVLVAHPLPRRHPVPARARQRHSDDPDVPRARLPRPRGDAARPARHRGRGARSARVLRAAPIDDAAHRTRPVGRTGAASDARCTWRRRSPAVSRSPRPDVVFTRDLGVAAALARVPRGRAPAAGLRVARLRADRQRAAAAAPLDRLGRRRRASWRASSAASGSSGSAPDGYVTITQPLARGARGAIRIARRGLSVVARRRDARARSHVRLGGTGTAGVGDLRRPPLSRGRASTC